MYNILISKINNELRIFVDKAKKYFNINVKNNILFFLNPKIKMIKTDLQIINKLLINPNYLKIKNSLLKLKYYLITERGVFFNNLFLRNIKSHKKFILFQLIYKKEPFNVLNSNLKKNYKKKYIFFTKIYKKKLLLLKSYKFYKKSTLLKNITYRNKTKLEIKSKIKNYKKKELINYFMHNELY